MRYSGVEYCARLVTWATCQRKNVVEESESRLNVFFFLLFFQLLLLFYLFFFWKKEEEVALCRDAGVSDTG